MTLNYNEWKKSHSKSHILYDSTYMTFQKRQNYKDRKEISGCQSRVVGSSRLQSDMREFSGVMKLLNYSYKTARYLSKLIELYTKKRMSYCFLKSPQMLKWSLPKVAEEKSLCIIKLVQKIWFNEVLTENFHKINLVLFCNTQGLHKYA